VRDEQWLTNAKGAPLLYDIFQSLSEAKEEYRKVEHGVALTEWICENDSAHFTDLANYIQALVE
jgi:hypothetical protein